MVPHAQRAAPEVLALRMWGKLSNPASQSQLGAGLSLESEASVRSSAKLVGVLRAGVA